jgi:hypothetical protein
MPLAWIHDLSKQQLEEFASQLGLSNDRTLDDLRKRVKEKWSTVELYLPSVSAAKFTPDMKPVQPGMDSVAGEGNRPSKVKIKLATDLISGIPVLSGTDPELILNFLIRANQIGDLKLIPDSDFMTLLMGRTTGRVMQILGVHLATVDGWSLSQQEIIATFLPPRVKERFLAAYVLERFQAPGEDLNSYVMAVVAAAAILDFPGTEPQLVHRMVQNLHPRIKSYFLFESRSQSIRELYTLATTVAEAVAVEEQRKRLTAPGQQGAAPRVVAGSMFSSEARPAKADPRGECWECGAVGHFKRQCPARRRHDRRAGQNLSQPRTLGFSRELSSANPFVRLSVGNAWLPAMFVSGEHLHRLFLARSARLYRALCTINSKCYQDGKRR